MPRHVEYLLQGDELVRKQRDGWPVYGWVVTRIREYALCGRVNVSRERAIRHPYRITIREGHT